MNKEYLIIDDFLKRLIEFGKLGLFEISKNYHSKESGLARNVLISQNLIENPKNEFKPSNYVWISKKGKDIIETYGGWKKYLEQEKLVKERDELRQQNEFENSILENDKLKFEKDLRELEVKLVQSNIDSNTENSETRKITNRNSTISLFIGSITVVALVVQILLSIFNEDKDQLKSQELKTEALLKQQETLKKQVDSLIFVRQEVIQDTIDMTYN